MCDPLTLHLTNCFSELLYFHRISFRPEGDSCLALDHCRAALLDRLNALRSDSGVGSVNCGGSSGEVERLEAQIEQVYQFYVSIAYYFLFECLPSMIYPLSVFVSLYG